MRSRSWRFRNLLTTSAPNVNDTPRSFSPQPCTSLSGSDHNRSHRSPADDNIRRKWLRDAAPCWLPGHTEAGTKLPRIPPHVHTHAHTLSLSLSLSETPSKTIRGSERRRLPGSRHRWPYTGVCSSRPPPVKRNIHNTGLLVLHSLTPALRRGEHPSCMSV